MDQTSFRFLDPWIRKLQSIKTWAKDQQQIYMPIKQSPETGLITEKR